MRCRCFVAHKHVNRRRPSTRLVVSDAASSRVCILSDSQYLTWLMANLTRQGNCQTTSRVIRGKRKVEDERLSTWTSVPSFKTLHGAFDSYKKMLPSRIQVARVSRNTYYNK